MKLAPPLLLLALTSLSACEKPVVLVHAVSTATPSVPATARQQANASWQRKHGNENLQAATGSPRPQVDKIQVRTEAGSTLINGLLVDPAPSD